MAPYHIDTTLTYQNAKERGYLWVDDMYPDYISEDMLQLINEVWVSVRTGKSPRR